MNGHRLIEGAIRADGLRIGIVASRFNSVIVEKLVAGALDALFRHGANAADQTLLWVPGAWELPVAALKMAKTRSFDAIICLGAVIKGSTYHFDYVAGEACGGIARVATETGIPVTNGILTVENLEQALDRAGGKVGNAGYSAALAAIETINALRQIG